MHMSLGKHVIEIGHLNYHTLCSGWNRWAGLSVTGTVHCCGSNTWPSPSGWGGVVAGPVTTVCPTPTGDWTGVRAPRTPISIN